MARVYRQFLASSVLAAVLVWNTSGGHGAEVDELREQLRELQRRNAALEDQLRGQQSQIDALGRKLADVARTQQTQADDLAPSEHQTDNLSAPRLNLLSKVLPQGNLIFSGEAGLAFFDYEHEGELPHSTFRVDEARLFLDARVIENVYLFAELNLMTREERDEFLRLGELYVDLEHISEWWSDSRWLNLRVGRFDIPFGKEYLTRDAIDNPLISHSLADLWGIDEGIEVYGSARDFSYILAVQNGGHPMLYDGNSDKAVVLQLSYGAAPWLDLSLSAMRTGNLSVQDDELSELWFGDGFIRSLGRSATTTRFGAELVQGDVAARWHHGNVKAAGGYLHYDDNDSTANNQRDVYYYSIEAVQFAGANFYAATRFSQILAPDGFPIAGAGPFGYRFFGPLTEQMSRAGVGGGYRWQDDMVLKLEYTFNWGRELDGPRRNNENMIAAELAVKF